MGQRSAEHSACTVSFNTHNNNLWGRYHCDSMSEMRKLKQSMPNDLSKTTQHITDSTKIKLQPVSSWLLAINQYHGEDVCMLSSFSHVQLFVTPWTVAHQAPLSMGFSRQEYWSESPFPSPGDLSNPGIKPESLMSHCIGKQVLYH